MGQEQCRNGARGTDLTNVSDRTKKAVRTGVKQTAKDVLGLRAVLCKDKTHGEENLTTYQQTGL